LVIRVSWLASVYPNTSREVLTEVAVGQLTWTSEIELALMRASLPARIGQEKPQKVKRHSPVAEGFSAGVQIIRKLRTAEQLLNEGQAGADVCLDLGGKIQGRWY
jgi:hypothetical protein